MTLCALSGLGGVGKTTLATEFAYKYGCFYDFVYWIMGGSREEILQSFSVLLELLEVPVPERRGIEEKAYYSLIIKLLNESLPRRHQHSLLIVDSIEDPALLQDLAPLNGHILGTSRYNDWFRNLEIDVLKRDESVALLLQLTGLDPRLSDQADILAEEIDDLPLALAQVAAYIKQQNLPAFEAYLDIYRASQADLLTRQQIQPSLNKRESVVMTTWNTTMQRLSAQPQQLMSYFSYLAPTEIPMQFFQDIENCEGSLR